MLSNLNSQGNTMTTKPCYANRYGLEGLATSSIYFIGDDADRASDPFKHLGRKQWFVGFVGCGLIGPMTWKPALRFYEEDLQTALELRDEAGKSHGDPALDTTLASGNLAIVHESTVEFYIAEHDGGTINGEISKNRVR